jgi:hypothetical protein
LPAAAARGDPRKLVTMNKCLDQVGKNEGLDRRRHLGDVKNELFLEAMCQINTLDPKLLDKAQDKIFGDGSPVRALSNALSEYAQNGALKEYGQVHVYDLIPRLGPPRYRIVEVDREPHRLRRERTNSNSWTPGVPVAERGRGRCGRSSRTSGPEQPHGATGLIDELKGHIGKFGEGDLATWHSTEVLERLEEEVRRHSDLETCRSAPSAPCSARRSTATPTCRPS